MLIVWGLPKVENSSTSCGFYFNNVWNRNFLGLDTKLLAILLLSRWFPPFRFFWFRNRWCFSMRYCCRGWFDWSLLTLNIVMSSKVTDTATEAVARTTNILIRNGRLCDVIGQKFESTVFLSKRNRTFGNCCVCNVTCFVMFGSSLMKKFRWLHLGLMIMVASGTLDVVNLRTIYQISSRIYW